MKLAGRLHAAENAPGTGGSVGHIENPLCIDDFGLMIDDLFDSSIINPKSSIHCLLYPTLFLPGKVGRTKDTLGSDRGMDRIEQALVEALRQALVEPGEQRLYRSGKLSGLFAGRTGPQGIAAAQALRDGLLEVVRTETKGKTAIEWVRLTPRGVEFLHERESPLVALQELRSTLRLNQQAIPVWLTEMDGHLQALDERLAADARKWLERLDALARRVDETLRRLEQSAPLLPPEIAGDYPWAIDVLNYLDRRRLAAGPPANGEPADCPLPELFTALAGQHPGISISVFHEGLRRLHERRLLHLRPAASLADLPQPEYALLDGAAVLYYAAR
jgi:DNA-binding PadR family transcriptional regulator